MIEWIRLHPYASTLTLAGVVVVLGAFLVHERSITPASSGISAWSGNAAALATTSVPAASAASAQAITTSVIAEDYGTATLPYSNANEPVSDSQGTIQTNDASSTYDFNALLAELTQKPAASASTASTNNDGDLVNAWSFVPTGIISISTSSNSRTPTQQALYQYGNEAGSYIQGYDATHNDQAQILTDAQNDRQNATKYDAVEKLGQDLETTGDGLNEITDVPAGAAAENTALAESYISIGQKLVAVGQAEPMQDSTLVSAIEAYDSAVNTFNTHYIALSTLFSSYGVTFSSSDPGSVFTFSSNAL